MRLKNMGWAALSTAGGVLVGEWVSPMSVRGVLIWSAIMFPTYLALLYRQDRRAARKAGEDSSFPMPEPLPTTDLTPPSRGPHAAG